MSFQIDITTPEKLVASKQADFAEIPGKDGCLGILPGHAAHYATNLRAWVTAQRGRPTEASWAHSLTTVVAYHLPA